VRNLASADEVRLAMVDVREALIEAARRLEELITRDDVTADDWQDVSAEVGVRMAVHREQMARVNDLLGLGNAQQRILRYLQRHVGEVVSGAELSGVAGIGEWARRVRELRVEHGWPIESGIQQPRLRSDEYVLLRPERDEALAAKWQLASRVRRQGGDVRSRILDYLMAVSPEAADEDELGYVGNARTWPSEVAKLRAEGWDVRSTKEEPELAPGTYRLIR
jgi:hypothetical protein